ncbi:MAG: DUF3298 domain-containing protein [Thermotogae bacterium]|nr:DUF3298 domain-containing protein [Thermotogota bacterium]
MKIECCFWLIMLTLLPAFLFGALKSGTLEIATSTVEATTDIAVMKIQVPYFYGYENRVIAHWMNELVWSSTAEFVNETVDQIRSSLKIILQEGGYMALGHIVVQGRAYKVNENVVSIVLDFYSYVPTAAHGNEWKKSFNMDLKRGELLTSSDLFFSKLDAIGKEIIKVIKSKPGRFFPGAIDVIEKHALRENFYLTEDSVVFYFGKYEISPGYVGVPEFKIPFSKLGINPVELGKSRDD